MATTRRRPVRSLITLLIVVVIGVAALLVGHTTRGAGLTPNLALDLEGGTQLILTPTSADGSDREVTSADLTEAINIIRNRVDASGVAEAEITSMGTDNIVVSLPGHPDKETLDLIRSSSQMDFRPVLVTGAATTQATSSGTDSTGAQSGAQSGEESAQSGEESTQSDAATDEDTPSGDAAQSGTATTALPEDQARQLADTNGDGTISDTPATTPSDHSDSAWVTEQALLDFYMLDCTDPASRAQGSVSDPDGPLVTCDEDGTYKYILGPVDVKGANLDTATAGLVYNSQGQSTGKWGVDLQFDAEGTKAFAEASQRLYDLESTDATRNRFAVVLDGNVITSPSMNSPITDGRAQISGNFTPASARALANQLSFGSLPLDFTVQSEQQISATLGSDHLEKGIWAGFIGLLLVVAYMIWQYRGLAVLSAGSLVVAAGLTYLVITLLSWLIGYRLSLPGVAGLIVAVGITADSFIVYFERIRDEVRDGRPLVAAVDEGWERAKRTIIVSDLVNLIAAAVLYFLAVGGVQGFAFTLGVTTIVDLVVIFFFTHPMMELLIRVPFFGEGHKLSGLDPEHLGAHSSAVYAGRGRVVVRGDGAATTAPTQPGEARKSLAERRFEAAHAAAATGEADATDGAADETKELDR
ncbi:protein translocase subunit SecD [Actinomyces sp.]|uniref:protein translocase subunit SecD n=1 Tax=Actinomyces sp. TaxID=29317 RepID=UPI0028996CFD|nr:protein translocase subunit SecD [Actinomyces sp.]